MKSWRIRRRTDGHSSTGGYAWSRAARAKLLFPAADLISAGAGGRFSAPEAAKQRFLAAVAENLAKAQYETFPQVNPSLVMRALPWDSRIWRVREVADLSLDLAEAIREASGVPANVVWPNEYQRFVDRLHGAKVFEVASLLGRIHIVAAFASPLMMRLGQAPELQRPNATTIEQIRSIYQRWIQSDSSRRPLYVFMSFGSFARWDVDVKGLIDDRTWVMCSSPINETWTTVAPPTLSDQLAIRNFVDRLKPETRGDRIARVRALVDRELDTGQDRVNVEKVRSELGIRRSAIRDAFFTLQDLKHYRVTTTGDGVLAIDRHVEWSDQQRVVRASLGTSTIRRYLGTLFSIAFFPAPSILTDVITGSPFGLRNYLTAALIGVFVGPYIDKYRSGLREHRDKD